MLKETLELIETTLPSKSFAMDLQRWPGAVAEFGGRLMPIADDLMEAIKPIVPARVWRESPQEFLSARQPMVSIVEFRLRPPNSYYEDQGLQLPLPADPKGPHATGLAVSLTLCRGYETRAGITAPFLALDFDVWGAHERGCFANLLRDHRYMVERLVTRSGATFFTSCVFGNVDKAKQASAFEQLVLYYENEVDDESQFSLQRQFGVQATQADITKALLPAVTLYDAALGYCLPQPQRGRILQYATITGAWN
jgi:hypothetical protein